MAVFSVLVSEAGCGGSQRAGGRDALPGLDLIVCSYDKLILVEIHGVLFVF